MEPDQSRLAALQRRRARKARAPEIVAAWALKGITVSVLSDMRHDELVEQFRRSATCLRVAGSLESIVAKFASAGGMVVIIGWDIDNEPALLVNSAALAQSGAFLRAIFPDGFVAISQPVTRGLMIDFDDSDFHADEVRFAEGH